MSQGKVAMWYDATSAAGSLEDPAVSKVAGKVGYAHAPVEKTKASGWLWAWAWAHAEDQPRSTTTPAKFISWASSKEYEKLVGEQARLGAGAGRQAGLDLRDPRVHEGRRGVRRRHAEGDRGGRPDQPGRAAAARRVGIQFVDIPEFADLGTKVSQDVSAADRRAEDASRRRWTTGRSWPRTSPRSTRYQ